MPGKTTKVDDAKEKVDTPASGSGEQTAVVGDSHKRTPSAKASAAAPRISSVTQPASNNACMAKPDLKDFVTVQISAVTGVLSLNPGQKQERGRDAYKWPTRSLGSQVGSSLTKLSGSDSGGMRSCSSAFRLNKRS